MNAHDESVLLHLNAALASTRSQDEFFTILVDKLRLLFAFERLSITTGSAADGSVRRVLVSDTRASAALPSFSGPQLLGEDFTEEFAHLRGPQTFRLADLRLRHPASEVLAAHARAGAAFVTLVPLQMRTAPLGMLSLVTRRDPAFSADDLALLTQVGHLVALSLSTAQAFEELARHAREKTVQLRLNNALLGSKTRDAVAVAVATELRRAMPCERLMLWLRRPDGPPEGFAEVQQQADGHFQPLPADYWEHHLASPVVKEQAFELFGSAPALLLGGPDPASLRPHAPELEPAAALAVLGVPLPLPGGLAGVLLLTSQAPHLLAPADLALVQSLVPQVALGLQNLLAFERIEELRAQLEQEKTYLMDEISTTARFEDFVGASAAMQQVQQRIRQVAPTDTTVLITGETGTGKELVARAVHNLSPRRTRPLVKLNCAALPAQLIESELFGHEKGAFTGAVERRIGKFELADGGTIFLDEIGELPLDLQAKLLRVLQEKEFERLGGRRVLRADVRVLAATNRVLEDEVAASRFRADLYYRLNVFPLPVPALRERPADVEPLLRYYLDHFTRRMGRPVRGLRAADLAALRAYPWPGNVRELEHVVERAVIVSQGPFLELSLASAPPPAPAAASDLRPLQEVERDHILAALRHTGGRVSGPAGAARLLGLKPTTLDARMKKLGLERTVVRGTTT